MHTRALTATAFVTTLIAAASARRDYTASEELSPRTQALMWPAYALGAGVITNSVVASRSTGTRASRVAGFGLVAVGAAFLLAGSARFRSLGQLAGRDAGDLVTGGPYRWTRHPQYVGNILLATGSAIASHSPAGALFAASVAGAYAAYVPAEEAHLERVFGDAYTTYRERTPRWLTPI